ncbi:MAG: hypothetical protein QM811_03160 [Pirellulales bacterium]
MEQNLIVHGQYIGRMFIPSEPMPEAEGSAQLVITPSSMLQRGSIAAAFGTAPVLRTGAEILAQTEAERDAWGNR